MVSFTSPFDRGDDAFDAYDEFVEDHLPRPGEFLAGHDVLVDDDHTAFHRLTRELFEERTVYDVTFGYNLARLNLDTSHRSAGYRYAREADDPSILRAEFTPTTPFCPQAKTLAVASFRAWNELAERHEYDLVRVRVAEMHQQSGPINDELADLEETLRQTGSIPSSPNAEETDADGVATRPGADGANAPF